MNADAEFGCLPPVPEDFVTSGPPLASGASAVVWRARHRVSGKEVALKVWFHPLVTDIQREKFNEESRLHQKLSRHPHIVSWLWAGAPRNGPAWMATELHGQSLTELLKRTNPLPLKEGLVISLDLLNGLAALHSERLVHRDVKPENVLVDRGRAALCDLGIAKHIDVLTRESSAGTSAYLAPELMRYGSQSQPDFRSDVFSAARTIRRALGNDVPQKLDQLLTRAQSDDPADRPADAADFETRLRRVSNDLGFPAPPALSMREPSPSEETRRAGRIKVLVTAAVVVVVVVGAVLYASISGRDRPADRPTTAEALPAARATPDIDAHDQPVVLSSRSGGDCSGEPRGRWEHQFAAQLVAVATVYYDTVNDKGCALLTKEKTHSFYNKKTYIALTVCNDQGRCDFDWFSYPREAGPVAVPSTNGCLSWRVSMRDPEDLNWVLRDIVGEIKC
jgi:serine/threonine protein kinase